MFKKLLSLGCLSLFISSILAPSVLAQTIGPYNDFQAQINAPEITAIDKAIVIDGTTSRVPDGPGEARYSWDFGDGNKKEGSEVLHYYSQPNNYTVTLEISKGDRKTQVQKDVFAYKKAMLLITDQEKNQQIVKYAEGEGVYMKLIQSFDSASDFISEEVLAKHLLESVEDIKNTDQIVIWTQGNAGLNALSRLQQQLKESSPIDFSQKTILVIRESITQSTRTQSQFQLIKPKNILVTKEAAIYPFIESKNTQSFLPKLQKGGYEFRIVDETTGKIQIWNFMSYFVNLLIDKGIPDNTLILILFVPVIATVVAFMKQVIGIATFGVYTPTILTLTFWMLGLKFALITFLIILTVGALTRQLLKKFRILYIPKMAIILTSVAITILAILIISVSLNLFEAKFFSFTIFPLLIMSTLTEKFVSIQAEKGWLSAAIIMFKTVLVAIISYFIIGGEIDFFFVQLKWEFIGNFILSYPEVIILLLFVNVFLGKWTGLRLLEYLRFREVFRHAEE